MSYRESLEDFAPYVPASTIEFIESERLASTITAYQSFLVPGLLQTREYTTAVVHRLRPDAPPKFASICARMRAYRQEILNSNPGPDVSILMDEAVLRRTLGSKDVMRRQLTHIADTAATLPRLTVQVIHASAGPVQGMQESFILHQHSSARVLWFESRAGMTADHDDDHITAAARVIDQITAIALDSGETVKFLRALAAEY